MDNGAPHTAVKALLGEPSTPGYLERYASLMSYLDQREALIALDNKKSDSWHAAQYVAASKYLSPSPGLKARARGIVIRHCAQEILAAYMANFPVSNHQYI